MKPQAAVHDLTGSLPRLGACVLAVLLLFGAAAGAARAASNSFDDCDRLASQVRSLDVPTTEIGLDVSEPAADDGDDFPAAAAPVLESDLIAPVLLLTPRVVSIFEEVFGAAVAGDEAQEDASPAGDARRSPVAGGGETAAPEESAPVPESADEALDDYLPRFQRQMYRTDI